MVTGAGSEPLPAASVRTTSTESSSVSRVVAVKSHVPSPSSTQWPGTGWSWASSRAGAASASAPEMFTVRPSLRATVGAAGFTVSMASGSEGSDSLPAVSVAIAVTVSPFSGWTDGGSTRQVPSWPTVALSVPTTWVPWR